MKKFSVKHVIYATVDCDDKSAWKGKPIKATQLLTIATDISWQEAKKIRSENKGSYVC